MEEEEVSVILLQVNIFSIRGKIRFFPSSVYGENAIYTGVCCK